MQKSILKVYCLICTDNKMENNFKFVVWVGGCDDYYVSYDRAKEHYDDWIDQGYDDVHLIRI